MLILGSQSPRRSEILNFFDIPFKQVSSAFDEEAVLFNGDPKEYAQILATGKAKALAVRFPSDIILTADTVVYKAGKLYGKPANEHEAFNHLKDLIGKWHSVFTALAIHYAGRDYQAIEETKVLFNSLTNEQIEAYHRKLPCEDKAGGYMIQGAGSLIVKKIEGCYYNVMGLPVNALSSLFEAIGINIWNHLKRQ